MTVDLNVLDHLGINLYSNIAAVLTEAVANAWDADAELVEIKIDPAGKWISIADDGVGMTVDEINAKYLRVGYRRREEDEKHGRRTAKGRPVMGRKGLGELSLFSIASTIDVQSARDGNSHGFRMTVQGIQQSVQKKQLFYTPASLGDEDISVTKGTLISLKDVKRQRLGRGAAALRKRRARRFSVIGESYGFAIKIDGQLLTPGDRGDLAIVQFLWELGDSSLDVSVARKMEERAVLPGRREGWPADWQLRAGWVPRDYPSNSTAKTPAT